MRCTELVEVKKILIIMILSFIFSSCNFTEDCRSDPDRTTCDNNSEDSSECQAYQSINEKSTWMGICSVDSICTNICSNHWDCKGEYEYCESQAYNTNDGETYSYNCEDITKKYDYCSNYDNQYPYLYGETPECQPLCNLVDCKVGFRCNYNNHCTPICLTNKDCENDKFSEGNICDTEFNYCVEE